MSVLRVDRRVQVGVAGLVFGALLALMSSWGALLSALP